MKNVKRVFYGIAILILLLCAGVFIGAFNPSVTDSLTALVQKLPGSQEEKEAQTQPGNDTASKEQAEQGEGTGEQTEGTEETEETYPTLDGPLVWEPEEEEKDDGKYTGKTLEDEGISPDSVLQDMETYYKDCYEQLIAAEGESIQFTNVIPKALWDSIESDYTDGSYKKGYSDKVLKEKAKDIFTIQIQAERLPENHYRIHHNVYIADEE